MDSINYPFNDCVDVVNQAANKLGCGQHLEIDNFKIKIEANEQGLIEWAILYLSPLALQSSSGKNEKYRYTIRCLNSDMIVSQIISSAQSSGNNINYVKGYGNRNLINWGNNNTIQICIAPIEGVVWVCDSLTHTLTIVYSSRTRWPSLEFARTVRDVITHLLILDGWLICHAGAVETDAENVMIIGGAGSGKTTQILALLNNDARYCANELLFAKPGNEGLDVLPFAIPIAIGMGTALQFEKIIAHIEKPYELLYPPRRLNAARLAKTSRKKWHKMNNKLQILASELVTVFPSSTPVGKLRIDRIVVPQISLTPVKLTPRSLNSDEVEDIVKNNLISSSNKKFTAPWLNFSSRPYPKDSNKYLLDKLKSLPAITLEYHVNINDSKISL